MFSNTFPSLYLGDFIGLGVSATKQFHKWPGMQEMYEELRYKPAVSFLKYNGEVLGGPYHLSHNPQIPVPIHRPKIQQALYDYAIHLDISVTFGQHVLEYLDDSFQSKAEVVTTTGERFRADIVVAADGVGSKSWQLVQGAKFDVRSSGFAIYRVAFPTELAHQDPLVAQDFAVLADGWDDIRFWLGPDTHAITITSKELTTWVLTHKVCGPHHS